MEATLYAMLAAYVREARVTLRPAVAPVRKPFLVFTVEDAIKLVESVCARTDDWLSILDIRHEEPAVDVIHARSRVASAFVASLELAKRGVVEVEQSGEAINVRRRRDGARSAA
jgi:segregation and condensation protein A